MRTVCVGDSVGVLLSSEIGAEDRAVWGSVAAELPREPVDADAVVASIGINDLLTGQDPAAGVARFLAVQTAPVILLAPACAPWRLRLRRAVHRTALPHTVRLAMPWWCWRPDGIHPNRRGLRRMARQLDAMMSL